MTGIDPSSPKLALLIDADNAAVKYLDDILREIASFGRLTVRRAYGNWTEPNLKGWKDELLDKSILPIQQFAYTRGKNATDSALIIDAMDLLYTGNLDGFCIVSSDSDFTRLASRLRESGLQVYGFGEDKTPSPMRRACDQFIILENLDTSERVDDDDGDDINDSLAVAPPPSEQTKPSEQTTAPSQHGGSVSSSLKTPDKQTASDGDRAKQRRRLNKLLRTAVDAAADDDGWASLSAVGQFISRLDSDFDPRSHGHAKLKDLYDEHPAYTVKVRARQSGRPATVHVRRTKQLPKPKG